MRKFRAWTTHSVCDAGFDVIRLGVTPSTWTPCPIRAGCLAWRLLTTSTDRKDDMPTRCSRRTRRRRTRSTHRLIVTYVVSGIAPVFPNGTFNTSIIKLRDYRSTAWLQRTWLNCVCPSLRQQVVVVGFGPPQPATWLYHAADCQPTAPVPLMSLVQSAGTLYRTIWSHLTFLLILLGGS